MPIEMGSICEGAVFRWAETYVQEEIDDLEKILISHSIELPSADSLKHFYFDRNVKVPMDKPEPGWGDFEDTECLSIIL